MGIMYSTHDSRENSSDSSIANKVVNGTGTINHSNDDDNNSQLDCGGGYMQVDCTEDGHLFTKLKSVQQLMSVKSGDMLQIWTTPKFDRVAWDTNGTPADGIDSSITVNTSTFIDELTVHEIVPVSKLPVTIKDNFVPDNTSMWYKTADTVDINVLVTIVVSEIVSHTHNNNGYYVKGTLKNAILAHGLYYPANMPIDDLSSVYKVILRFDHDGQFINFSDTNGYPDLVVSSAVNIISH